MKRSIYRSDMFRLVHSNKFLFSIAGIVAIVLLSNVSEVLECQEFLAVDTIMDNFLYGGWYRNLLFIVAAYPFSRSYYQDTVHGFCGVMIQKAGILQYAGSKVWCTAFSAFTVTFSGLLLSAGIFGFFCVPCYYGRFGEMNYTYPYGGWRQETQCFFCLREARCFPSGRLFGVCLRL